MPLAAMWMELEDKVRHEISQREEDTYWMISLTRGVQGNKKIDNCH